MAMKKTTSKPPKVSGTSAGKSNPKAVLKGKGSLPKVTKSRGSKTAKQVGDMNQRESYAANRSKDVKGIVSTRKKAMAEGAKRGYPLMGSKNSSSDYSKVSKAEASGTYGGVKEARKVRNQQRAGGRGK